MVLYLGNNITITQHPAPVNRCQTIKTVVNVLDIGLTV